MNIIQTIQNHSPFDKEEEFYKKSFLQFLKKFSQQDWAIRENLIGHLTASSWVVNRDRTKVLFAFHNIYQSWAWLGGHADGDFDLLHVAQKEAKEEAGIKAVKPVIETPFDLSVQTVDPHVRKGVFVPSHLHFNVTYLLEAGEEEVLEHRPDENSAVAWLNTSTLLDKVSEEFIKPTYTRIMTKVEEGYGRPDAGCSG